MSDFTSLKALSHVSPELNRGEKEAKDLRRSGKILSKETPLIVFGLYR